MNHHHHTIKKTDTLQSVAKQYSITVEELRRYHNTYCKLPDLLGHEITHQKELFIPISKKEEEQTKEIEKKKVSFAPKNTLGYFPINSHYKYGVMITLENGEEKNEIKYEASVKWVQKYEESHVFEIDRISKIFVNEEEVNDIADSLAYETSKVLYPMHILVDEETNWVEAAKYNHYPERWKTIEKEIRKEFEGEMVEDYLQKIEKILETPEQITRYISGDFFIRTLFLGYSTNFGKDYTKEKHIGFPVIENPIEPIYKINFKIEPYLDEYNLINVEMEGVLDDERSQGDFINGSPFPFEEYAETERKKNNFGNFEAQLFLNPNSCVPEAIHLECSIDLEETKKVSVVIANLSETGSINVRNREVSVFEGEVAPKKSFWGGVNEFFKEMNDPEYRDGKAKQEIAENLKKYHNKK